MTAPAKTPRPQSISLPRMLEGWAREAFPDVPLEIHEDLHDPQNEVLHAVVDFWDKKGGTWPLFLAVYASQGGMAELNNVGFVSAPDAKAARARACQLFSVAANCASAIHITPMSDLQDGWSYYR